MGAYQCLANNGIPPTANQTFEIEVRCKYTYFVTYVMKYTFSVMYENMQ